MHYLVAQETADDYIWWVSDIMHNLTTLMVCWQPCIRDTLLGNDDPTTSSVLRTSLSTPQEAHGQAQSPNKNKCFTSQILKPEMQFHLDVHHHKSDSVRESPVLKVAILVAQTEHSKEINEWHESRSKDQDGVVIQ